MDGDARPQRTGFDGVLDWIEAHLGQPLTVERIARAAGLSPYHFSRLFTARMGRSPMFHVRYRRLIKAARRLTVEADLKLVELALDSGFESQEAFTRAFTRTFGSSPGRFRRAYVPQPPDIRQTPEHLMSASPHAKYGQVHVAQLPDLVRRDAFSVAGLSHRFDDGTKMAIPGLWQRLMSQMPYDGQSGPETYGVVSSVDRDDGSFLYMAAGRLDPAAAAPDGLERKDLPASTYVVFRLTMGGGPVHPQIRSAMQTIWGELIPASGLVLTGGPDFELYEGTTAPDQPGAVIDFYVPVQA